LASVDRPPKTPTSEPTKTGQHAVTDWISDNSDCYKTQVTLVLIAASDEARLMDPEVDKDGQSRNEEAWQDFESGDGLHSLRLQLTATVGQEDSGNNVTTTTWKDETPHVSERQAELQ
jgi:hypothetical protein